MGIEPTSEAWEASILPLYDARSFLLAGRLYIIKRLLVQSGHLAQFSIDSGERNPDCLSQRGAQERHQDLVVREMRRRNAEECFAATLHAADRSGERLQQQQLQADQILCEVRRAESGDLFVP